MARPKSIQAVTNPEQTAAAQTVPEVFILPRSGKGVNRRTLAKLQEKKFYEHVEPMLEEFFTSLRMQMRSGSSKATDTAAEILGYVKQRNGISVVNNIAQSNSNRAEAAVVAGEGRSFAQIVRRLEARDGQAPSRDIIDVASD